MPVDANSILLSLVIPAYNESERLPPYLQMIRTHLDAQFGRRYEVVVADDGSTDGMAQVIESLQQDWPQLHSVRQADRSGKGAAVRTGVRAAVGQIVLFADADGATPIQEETKLRAEIEAGADMAVGSRLLDAKEATQQRTLLRSLAGRGFAWFARKMVPLAVRDTQCGFKMFRGEVAEYLFSRSQEDGYLFDIELLILAQARGYRIAEVPVNWADQPNSRLSMLRESWRILTALRRLRRLQRDC